MLLATIANVFDYQVHRDVERNSAVTMRTLLVHVANARASRLRKRIAQTTKEVRFRTARAEPTPLAGPPAWQEIGVSHREIDGHIH
jgi:hypothetical protein